MNLNVVILAGNLTRDVQLSYLPSQTPVAVFGLAINRKWKDQAGKAKEEVCFVDCKAFGKTAETLNQYMAKGRPILVQGRLKYETWEDKEGNKRSRHVVMVDSFQFVPDGQQHKASKQGPTGIADAEGVDYDPGTSADADEDPDFPDDLPF